MYLKKLYEFRKRRAQYLSKTRIKDIDNLSIQTLKTFDDIEDGLFHRALMESELNAEVILDYSLGRFGKKWKDNHVARYWAVPKKFKFSLGMLKLILP